MRNWVSIILTSTALFTVNISHAQEEFGYHKEIEEVASWWDSERFEGIIRPYTPERVLSLRETLHQEYPSNTMAKKAWHLFTELSKNGGYSHTFGALDPVQVVEMAPYLTSVYVSGWQSSSTASTSHEPGPDFADYPMDTVPTKVFQLFEAQRFHDRKQNELRSRMTAKERASHQAVDYLRPIIADADTGHGGLTAVMKLTKMFIQRGAAGIHLEDQKPGTKKCGHMSGKVLVSTQEHCDRLIASRLQADIMGSELILVARTDAEAADLLDNNIDPRDHAFILGATEKGIPSLAETVRLATETQERKAGYRILNKLRDSHPTLLNKIFEVWEVRNQISEALSLRQATQDLEKQEREALNNLCGEWRKIAKLKTFYAAVKEVIEESDAYNRDELLEIWRLANDPLEGASQSYEPLNALSHQEAVNVAKELGVEIYWNWNAPRTFEGYYQIDGGIAMCIARGRSFAPYADMLWMESAVPSLHEAQEFSRGVKKLHPKKFLAYNLSPSFNWDKFGMTDEELISYQDELGKMGFVWQFITLAGFHGDALFTKCFSEDYAERKMLAYVERIQRQERANHVSTLTHQKWSGVDLIGSQQDAVTVGRSSTGAADAKSTENQFGKKEEIAKKTTSNH